MTHQPLPRLANLVALRSSDPASRQRFSDRLQTRGHFRIFAPAAHWVVGVHDLPGSAEPNARDEANGYFFAEGQACLPSEERARAEARRLLQSTPDRAATSSEDAEDLTFLVVRPNGTAVFQRSLGGRVPCYWWPRGEDLVLSTDSSELIRIGEHDGRPDPLITALCLVGSFNHDIDRRAHLLGSHRLSKAEGLAIDSDGRRRVYEHWQPQAFRDLRWPTRAQRQDRLQQFRSQLIKGLDAGLAADGCNLLSLSGGVDSSLLLALAAGKLGRPVASTSVIPAPDDPVYARETERIAWLRSLFPTTPHLSFEFFSETLFRLWRQLKPAAMPMFNPTIAGLAILHDRPAPHVSFGGESADLVCGSHDFTLGDWMLHAPPLAWNVAPADLPPTVKRVDLFQRARFQERIVRWKQPLNGRLESWMHRDIHQEWDTARGKLEARFLASFNQVANPFLWARHRDLEWQPTQWEWCSAQGVRRENPFSASRLVAIALRSHPVERLGRHDKQLSRLAFEEDLPPKLLARSDKGMHQKPLQYGLTPAAWRQCTDALHPAWTALIDPTALELGAPSALNESQRLSNLQGLRDQPQRLAFFSENVYKICKGDP